MMPITFSNFDLDRLFEKNGHIMVMAIKINITSILEILLIFLEKITSFIALELSGLNSFFHIKVQSFTFCKSKLNSFAVSIGDSTFQKRAVSSANNLTLDFSPSGKSLMKIRKSSGPNIDPCGTPA